MELNEFLNVQPFKNLKSDLKKMKGKGSYSS